MTVLCRVESPATITPDEVEDMYQIREIYMNLKPNVSKLEDKKKFVNFFHQSEDVFVIRNKDDNKIQGMTFLQRRKIKFGDTSYSLIMPDYGFRRPDMKGKASFSKGAVSLGLKYLSFQEQVVAFMVLYPTSYNFFRRSGFVLWNLHDDQLHDEAKLLLSHIATESEGENFDKERKVIRFRTIPDNVELSKGLRHSTYLKEYEAMNPHWKEGYGVPFLLPINPYVILRVILYSLYWYIFDIISKVTSKRK